jgi:hypothetical protein
LARMCLFLVSFLSGIDLVAQNFATNLEIIDSLGPAALGIFYGTYCNISSTQQALHRSVISKSPLLSTVSHCLLTREEVNEREGYTSRMLSEFSHKTGCWLNQHAVMHTNCPMFILRVTCLHLSRAPIIFGHFHLSHFLAKKCFRILVCFCYQA